MDYFASLCRAKLIFRRCPYRELKKSIELNGVKDPVLTRINPEGGGLEIVSGQRRHMIAKELNYPVPAIIQKLDDADVKILVNDGNLHRPHISTYDLARALRGKMEGMKQKAGRKKKGAPTAEELNSDETLAQEMGRSVSKLNRIIRLSEASKDVCDRVDDGSLPLSVASAISFLKPQNQDEVLHLNDLGYQLDAESIGYMLCRRFGVDCKAPQTGEVARLYEGYEPTDRGEALEALRKAARNMGDGIERSIQPRQQERGRRHQGIR